MNFWHRVVRNAVRYYQGQTWLIYELKQQTLRWRKTMIPAGLTWGGVP